MKRLAKFLINRTAESENIRKSQEIQKEIHDLTEAGKNMNKLQNEGKDGYDYVQHQKIDKLIKELQNAKFKEDWSLEQTIEKRKKWNEEIKAIIKGGVVDPKDLVKVERVLGYKVDELKKAVEHYKTKGEI